MPTVPSGVVGVITSKTEYFDGDYYSVTLYDGRELHDIMPDAFRELGALELLALQAYKHTIPAANSSEAA